MNYNGNERNLFDLVDIDTAKIQSKEPAFHSWLEISDMNRNEMFNNTNLRWIYSEENSK